MQHPASLLTPLVKLMQAEGGKTQTVFGLALLLSMCFHQVVLFFIKAMEMSENN